MFHYILYLYQESSINLVHSASNIVSLIAKNEQILYEIGEVQDQSNKQAVKSNVYLTNVKIVAKHRLGIASEEWKQLKEKVKKKPSSDVTKLVQKSEKRIMYAIGFRDSSMHDLLDQADTEIKEMKSRLID